jgi:multimeric flavodoxin WrbA
VDKIATDAADQAAGQAAGLLIIWHSRTGAAQAMAEAALAGAREDGDAGADHAAITRLVRAADALPADMLAAAGYLFVCPENLGTMSGEMKEFFDRCYYPLVGQIEGRGYASAIAAGNAGQGAEAQIDRIVTGWRLRRIAPSLIVQLGANTTAAIIAPKMVLRNELQRCGELGRSFAAGLQLGIF